MPRSRPIILGSGSRTRRRATVAVAEIIVVPVDEVANSGGEGKLFCRVIITATSALIRSNAGQAEGEAESYGRQNRQWTRTRTVMITLTTTTAAARGRTGTIRDVFVPPQLLRAANNSTAILETETTRRFRCTRCTITGVFSHAAARQSCAGRLVVVGIGPIIAGEASSCRSSLSWTRVRGVAERARKSFPRPSPTALAPQLLQKVLLLVGSAIRSGEGGGGGAKGPV